MLGEERPTVPILVLVACSCQGMKKACRTVALYDPCWESSRNSNHFFEGNPLPLVLEPGTMLTSYKLLTTIGQGGMGAVYLAEDASGRKRAIKEMVVDIREPVERAKAIEQFASEAAMLRTLSHPLLVEVHETFVVDQSHYMVMDYIEGSTLSEFLEETVELPAIEDVLSWADQICDVLDYLHNCEPPVIFRDLKPSNVMLQSDGGIRLIDFGIARVFEDESRTSTFLKGVGSRGYAPIEQYGAGGTDIRTDIYSLGATLYNVLTGVKPPASVSIMAGTEQLEPLRCHNPAIPRALEQAVLRMMSLQKDNRYSSVAQVRTLLKDVAEGSDDNDFTDDLSGDWDEEHDDLYASTETSQAQPEPEPEPEPEPPKRTWLRLGVLSLLLVSLVVASFNTPEDEPPPPAPPISLEAKNRKLALYYRERARTVKQSSSVDWRLLLGRGTWRYLDDGTDLGVGWRAPGFDDSKWKKGPEPFGYGDEGRATILSFGEDEENKHNTYYFRREFELEDFDQLQSEVVRLRIMRDDGAVVYLNGKECFRTNMPLGEVDYQTKSFIVEGAEGETEFFVGAIDASLFVPGKNLLAVEVHQATPDSSDLGLSLVLERHTCVKRIGFGSTWKVSHDLDEPDWNVYSYDDSSWGTTQLGQASSEAFVPSRLRTTFEVSSLAGLNGIRCFLRQPGEVKIYLNGSAVFSSQPTLPFTGAHQPGWLDLGLLLEGQNVVAVESLGPDASTNGESFDLQLITTP
jgi:serine/threonine protein kinase